MASIPPSLLALLRKSGGEDPHPEPPVTTTTPPTTDGGGPPGTTSATPSGRAPFVDPSFYRTPMFPYANLADQLKDALGLSGRGAWGYANQMTGRQQRAKAMPANLGGGLLGMTAYARGTPYSPGGGGPGGGMPPGGGYGPVTPGTGPAGTPTIPGGYTPGSPITRPTPVDWTGSPTWAGGYTPGRTYRGSAPTGTYNPTGGSRGGGAGGPDPRGLLGPPSVPPGPPPGSPSYVGSGPFGGFNPGTGDTDAGKMADYFMSLPEAQRGNYFNAISQYSLGKGGAANLGAALQGALRAKMGSEQFSQWLTGMDNKQGSTVSREGLPAWLVTALGG